MAKKEDSRQRPLPGLAAPVSTAESIDRELAAKALQKRQRGETPTQRELSALKRFEEAREEEQRWQHYRTIPKKHWAAMSGRQQKVLNEQAARYGIPIGEAVIDLTAAVRWIHNFFAKHAKRLALDEDDELAAGPSSPELERSRRIRADLAELELQEKLGQLVPLEPMREAMTQLGTILRRCGENLQRQCGEEANAILQEALEEFDDTVTRELGGGADGNSS